ncbi:MAG: LCP family protein, partial [bacterium]|nr:LCP family protein [bacterium]
LPMTYILILAAVLLILLGITLLTQIAAKGKGLGGKIFCIIMCVILAAGSFYLEKVNEAAEKIFGSNTSTSAIVVAVKADDKAEVISDAASYTFGIQYATYEEEMRTGLANIRNEIGNEIEVQEYSDLIDEATALINGEIKAMIYNSSQTSIIQEQIPEFSQETKIIYTHNIVLQIANETVDVSMSEPFTVYLSGMDTYNEISSADRSDVNIIAVVNPKSHQILLVTTPRDFYVPIPGISGGQRDKLTHAGIYGIDASMRTLEELYETEIQFFGRVNFTSLINIVDALGGLEVISDEEFDTGWESGTEIHVNEGANYFDGKSALAFCRERHALADGDNARGRHQQAVITAMIKKMMSPAMLRGATEIIQSVSDGVDTNFSMDQIQTLIKTQLRKNSEWNIYSVSAEGFGDKQYCYSSGNTPLYVTIPDENSVANIIDLINRVEAGEVLEGSTSTSE